MTAASGFAPATYRGQDPKADLIEIRLPPAPSLEGKSFVHARVIGPAGVPVTNAMAEVEGVGNAGGGTSYGGTQGFPWHILAATNGEFFLSRDEPFTSVRLSVSASGLATLKLWLDASNTLQTIEMTAGATIRGRVLKDGKPLDKVRVGLVGKDRNSEVFAGDYTAETDTNGAFTFPHLPPDTSWNLYGLMNSLRKFGAIPSRLIQSGADGEITEAGDLSVVPSLKLSGRVRSRHGEALPKGFKVRLGYENAWDSQESEVDDQGRFVFEGLPKGGVDLLLDDQDWRLTGANRSLDLWNPWELTGRLEDNKDDLVLEVEKGKREYNSSSSGNGQLPTQDWPQNRPLAGAEDSGPTLLTISGQYWTTRPVGRFRFAGLPPATSRPVLCRPVSAPLPRPCSKRCSEFRTTRTCLGTNVLTGITSRLKPSPTAVSP